MGQTNKQDRLDRLSGAGIEGSMSRSESGSEHVRERRAAQREGVFAQRFDPDQFCVDSEGRVSLEITDNLATRMDLVEWRQGEAGLGHQAPIVDLGYTFGVSMDAVNDEWHGHWFVPPACDRTKDVVLTVYGAQIGTTSAAFTADLEVYPYKAADNVVTADGSPSSTEAISGTTSTTSGAAHVQSFTLKFESIFLEDVVALVFRGIVTAVPGGSTNVAYHLGSITYTPTALNHTHE